MHAAAATAFAILFQTQTLGTQLVELDFFLNSGRSYFCFALGQESFTMLFSQPLQVAFRLIIMLCSRPIFVYLTFTFARCKNKSCFGFNFFYFTENHDISFADFQFLRYSFHVFTNLNDEKSILHENNIIHL